MRFLKKQKHTGRDTSRRGRTKPVYSYYSSRSKDKTTRARVQEITANGTRKISKNASSLGLYVILIALVIGLGFTLRLNSNPNIIQNEESRGVFLHDNNTYQKEASKLFKSSIWNKNKVTVDAKSITNGLKKQFPELSEVSISVPITGITPIVHISSSAPAIVLSNDSGDYILDNEGKVIGYKTDIDSSIQKKIPRVIDKSGLDVKVGETVLPRSSIDFIDKVSKQLVAKHLKIKSITLPPVAEEVDIMPEGQQYLIKFNLLGDARVEAGAYMAVKENLDKKGVNPKQYFDVRVEQKVYYK